MRRRRKHFVRFRLQHEDGFRQIHLARDLHHLFVADTFRFGKHRERVTAKSAFSKNVELEKIIIFCLCFLPFFN